jgi:thymidylate kinase
MIVAFEGIHGGGKSTLLRKVGQGLSERSIPCVQVGEFPAEFLDGAIERLRARDPLLNLHPTVETSVAQTLLMASLFAFKSSALIDVHDAPDRVVLVDRFRESLRAYQSLMLSGAGVSSVSEASRWIDELLLFIRQPDLVVFVCPPFQVAAERLKSRAHRVGAAEMRFLEALSNRFREQMAQLPPDRVHVAPNLSSIDEQSAEIISAICHRLGAT